MSDNPYTVSLGVRARHNFFDRKGYNDTPTWPSEARADVSAMTPIVPNRIWRVAVLSPQNAVFVHQAREAWCLHAVKMLFPVVTGRVFGWSAHLRNPRRAWIPTMAHDYIELACGSDHLFVRWDRQGRVTLYYGYFADAAAGQHLTFEAYCRDLALSARTKDY